MNRSNANTNPYQTPCLSVGITTNQIIIQFSSKKKHSSIGNGFRLVGTPTIREKYLEKNIYLPDHPKKITTPWLYRKYRTNTQNISFYRSWPVRACRSGRRHLLLCNNKQQIRFFFGTCSSPLRYSLLSFRTCIEQDPNKTKRKVVEMIQKKGIARQATKLLFLVISLPLHTSFAPGSLPPKPPPNQ